MSYWVPHAAGDYANIEIKYKDISDNIKPENPVWKNFITNIPANTATTKSSLGNIKDIRGFTPFENQSFMVNLNSWGEVRFVSGKITTSSFLPVVIYLTNKAGDILYDFNNGADAPFPSDGKIEAVSFQDVNKDGLKDIIIITTNAHGKTSAAVYLQNSDGSFATNFKLNQEINDSGNNKDIQTVKNYLSQKF
ncbi:MAG: hypothetical protein Q8936_23465 [Bacillota bacterium]|nr:hypothetical protein [Bacillota bacterium]